MRVSNDGQLFSTSGDDNLLKLWDLKTQKLLAIENGHPNGINGMEFSCDSKQLITVGNDSNIMLWNVYRT